MRANIRQFSKLPNKIKKKRVSERHLRGVEPLDARQASVQALVVPDFSPR